MARWERAAAISFAGVLLATASLPAGAAAVKGRGGASSGVKRQGTWTPRVEAFSGTSYAELVVNGQTVLRLRKWQGSFSPDNRVAVAADRLRAALAAGAQAGDVTVDAATDKANVRLKLAGQVIATADIAEAKVASSSPAGLANAWAGALRRALAVPGLTVSDTGLVVPLNEARLIRIGGAARGDLAIAAASGAQVIGATGTGSGQDGGPKPIVSVTLDPTGGLRLTGLAPGRDVLTLTREGATATVTVAVQPYAGRFDVPRAVTITGTGVTPELVARLGSASALAAAQPNPGAVARVAAETFAVSVPPPGESRPLLIPVTLSGPEMIPVTRTLNVGVTHRTLPPVNTGTLFYSNNPERLTQYGTLFVGRLATDKGATRLLLHHQSALDAPIWFTAELINDGSEPAQVQVVGDAAGPVRDTVWVGYRAAADFLKDWRSDSGAVVTVPARSRVALIATRLPSGQTISGLMQLRVVSGQTAPLVRIAAEMPGGPNALPSEWLPFPLASEVTAGAGSFPLSDHVYPDPTKKVTASYAVGGPWAFIPIGKDTLTGSGDAKLFGNYGVIYDVDVALENPTSSIAKARVVFEPAAGLAGGIFRVDGRDVDIPQTNLPNEPELAVYTLQPGEKRTVRVQTVPLSGSNYPVRIVVRP